MRFPCFAQNSPDAGRARLGHLNEDTFVFVRDHCSGCNGVSGNIEAMGRPGLEPGTNALKGRCSTD